MIKCSKCGFENNDESWLCSNCHQVLIAPASAVPNAERQSSEHKISSSEKNDFAEKPKNPLSALLVIGLVVVFFIIIYYSSLLSPNVDSELIGTWETDSSFALSEVWTFRNNGTYTITVLGHTQDMYYSAENGVLKLAMGKDIDKYTFVAYEYWFEVTNEGETYLVLDQLNDAGNRYSITYLAKRD